MPNDPIVDEAEKIIDQREEKMSAVPLEWYLATLGLQIANELTRLRFEATAIRQSLARIAASHPK